MKKYLALVLLVSLAGVQAANADGPSGDLPAEVKGRVAQSTEHPQSWAELLQSKRPFLMSAAAVAGLGYWKFFKGNNDWTFLTKEACESAAVAYLALGGAQATERQLVRLGALDKAVVGPLLDREDTTGKAARAGFGLALGAFAAHRNINPLSGDINPVDLAMGALGK